MQLLVGSRDKRVHSRDEHFTGLGMVWIRSTANFVEFGLEPDCKSFQNLGTGPDLDFRVDGKEIQHFCCEKAAFFKFYGLQLGWTLPLKKASDYGWTWTEFKKSGLDVDHRL